MAKYEYTEKMDEISGFGGGYEEQCRRLVIAGLEWWDKHSESKPKYSTLKNVFGMIISENPEAEEMDKAMVGATDGDVTGAMMHAAHEHIRYIRKNGWDAYVKEMEKKDEKEQKCPA